MSILPTQKTQPSLKDPKNLILFGLPKVGKTTALVQLPNALLIDLENGSDYQSGHILKANNYQDLFKIAKALKTEKHNFKFVVLDTVSALEDISLELALRRYTESPVGKNFTGDNVLILPKGAGYYWLRLAMQEIIGWFQKTVDNLILVGHVKDTMLNENGTDVNIKALDLSGKISTILSSNSDGIGYVYRDLENSNLMINFGDKTSVLCGSRIAQLSGRTLLLAEKKEDNSIVTYWEKIYPSLQTSK